MNSLKIKNVIQTIKSKIERLKLLTFILRMIMLFLFPLIFFIAVSSVIGVLGVLLTNKSFFYFFIGTMKCAFWVHIFFGHWFISIILGSDTRFITPFISIISMMFYVFNIFDNFSNALHGIPINPHYYSPLIFAIITNNIIIACSKWEYDC